MRALVGSILLARFFTGTLALAQGGSSGHGGALRLGISVGTSTFNGATAGTDESGADLVFRPYRPTMFGLAVAYGRERWRVGLSAKYGEPGLGFRGVSEDNAGSVLIVAENAFNLASFTGSIGTALLHLRDGPVLRASLGITVEHWMASGTPSRTRAGPQAGLALEFELSRSLIASIDGELGFTAGSPFLEEDLPEGFRLRSTWRRTLGVGLGLRL